MVALDLPVTVRSCFLIQTLICFKKDIIDFSAALTDEVGVRGSSTIKVVYTIQSGQFFNLSKKYEEAVTFS